MRIITSQEKRCPTCKETKSLSEWPRNKAKKDGLGSECKVCVNLKQKAWYRKEGNAEKHKVFTKQRRADNKQRLVDYFSNVCLDCKNTYPHCVYEFHHLDPSGKDAPFGYIATCSWERIEKEIIGKCVMLCANCHRIRHHGK